MAIFNNMSITNKGKSLYAKAQAGKELHFTKMMVGGGDIGTQNPETLITLVDPKYDVGIQSISPNTLLKTATIAGMINNSNITNATYICEIGLFAQDPDDGEILYAYGSAGKYGDYMAPATSGAYSWNYQINAAIGNAANVTVELSNLVYDYGVVNTNTTFIFLSGGNQKEINKSIDNSIKSLDNSVKALDNSIKSTNVNVDRLRQSEIPYGIATGGNNNYSVSLSPAPTTYKEGMPLSIKINVDSNGPSTININSLGSRAIKKANGNAVTNLKANGIYTLRYNSTTGNFILQGEGASGNAIKSDLLSGKKADTDLGEIEGNMPNIGAITIVPGTTNKTIPPGYHNGNGYVQGDGNLIPSNIMYNKTIFGVTGDTPTYLKEVIKLTFNDTAGHSTHLKGTPTMIWCYSPNSTAINIVFFPQKWCGPSSPDASFFLGLVATGVGHSTPYTTTDTNGQPTLIGANYEDLLMTSYNPSTKEFIYTAYNTADWTLYIDYYYMP